MKKSFKVLLASMAMSVLMSATAFAGSWQFDSAKGAWWWQNSNGSWPSNGWEWIDGRCYCFDNSGYMYANTTTSDGYTVDASGAWIENGVVKTQAQEVNVGSMTIRVPNCHTLGVPSEGTVTFSGKNDGIVAFSEASEKNVELAETLGEQALTQLLANAFAGKLSGGPLMTRSAVINTPVGAWYQYEYTQFAGNTTMLTTVNVRLVGAEIQYIVTTGSSPDINLATFVSDYVI